MHISQISSKSFQGKFQKTPSLKKIMKDAGRDSLGKFNDIIKKASNVNDGLVFKFIEFPSSCNRKIYYLHKTDTFKDVSSIVTGVAPRIDDAIGSGSILDRFLPILEKLYPQKYMASKENLIEEITKNLI